MSYSQNVCMCVCCICCVCVCVWQGLKVKYNSLAPYHTSCMEDGQSLVKVCEEGDPRSDLDSTITQHHADWDELQKLFGELHEKLTAALAQVRY